jgi:putative ATP-dependent endonuclease of OLD family
VGLTDREEREVQRMMDVTKSALYFAKGIILVEGPCEALLLPELARRVDPKYDLAKLHIAVIPITGVSFGAFKKILSEKGVHVPVAIITDGDPAVQRTGTWETDTPQTENGKYMICARTIKLRNELDGKGLVKVFASDVTLEFDLAAAGDGNPAVMTKAWETLFDGTPGTLNTKKLAAAANASERRLLTWRGICRSQTEMGKPEFAQRLATFLQDETTQFAVPPYLCAAIKHVTDPLLEAAKPAANANT